MKLPVKLVGADKETQDRIRTIWGPNEYMNQDIQNKKLFMVGNDPCWTDPKQISPNEDSNWILDENGIKIFVDHLLVEGLKCQDKIKYAWIYEPTAIIKPFVDHVKDNVELYANSYNKIFTHNKELASLHENIIFVEPGFPSWIEEPQIHKKTKLVSMITSTKNFCEGHRQRIVWANKLQGKLDLFGRGHNPIVKKEEGLCDYMFSVSMENDDTELCFTEKLLDCFLTGTVPVYWGCKGITELFDDNGIIWLNNDFNVDNLSEDLYNTKLESIKRNFETAVNINKGISEMLDLFVDNHIMKEEES